MGGVSGDIAGQILREGDIHFDPQAHSTPRVSDKIAPTSRQDESSSDSFYFFL